MFTSNRHIKKVNKNIYKTPWNIYITDLSILIFKIMNYTKLKNINTTALSMNQFIKSHEQAQTTY